MKRLSKELLAAEKQLTSMSAKVDKAWFRAPLDMIRAQDELILKGTAIDVAYAAGWLDTAGLQLIVREKALVEAGATTEMLAVTRDLDAQVLAFLTAEFDRAIAGTYIPAPVAPKAPKEPKAEKAPKIVKIKAAPATEPALPAAAYLKSVVAPEAPVTAAPATVEINMTPEQFLALAPIVKVEVAPAKAEDPKAAKKAEVVATKKTAAEQKEMTRILSIYNSMSTENLAGNMKLSAKQISDRRAKLEHELKNSFKKLGRTVSIQEAIDAAKAKNA